MFGWQTDLQSARVALIVEGEEDRRSLAAVLGRMSPSLKDALESGELAIESLGGGTKLTYRLTQYSAGACAAYVFSITTRLVGRQ